MVIATKRKGSREGLTVDKYSSFPFCTLPLVLPVPAESAFLGDAYSSTLIREIAGNKKCQLCKYNSKEVLTKGNFCATMELLGTPNDTNATLGQGTH
jgi:hypothetical protein